MSDHGPYISRKTVDLSYRPKSYVMSPGLKRAREPYRVRNAVTGVLLLGFGVGVWHYSIRSVRQDEFADVDEEARALVGKDVRSLEDEEREKHLRATPVFGVGSGANIPPTAEDPIMLSQMRGILARAFSRMSPSALDPLTKTFVWGAPPVDNIGRISDSR